MASPHSDATAFFEAQFRFLTGHIPMGWQRRLFRDHFLRAATPPAMSLPTGLGKTSVMVIWLLAVAWQLRATTQTRLPLRLVYIVDRRSVVDQATTFALRIQEKLTAPEAEPLREALGLANGENLAISTLRGQFVDSGRWLENPARPAIVVGTVDMIGSRLLFQGYGVTRRMRPYHAGLLGVDSLMVLDESHLVPPFQRLLERIASGTDADGRVLFAKEPKQASVLRPLRFMPLSATGGFTFGHVFELEDDDLKEPIVRMRLEASKRITLLKPVNPNDLPQALVEHAWRLAHNGTKPTRLVVFCTSRDHAQKVQALLEKRASKAGAIATQLLVGERRVYERQMVAQWLETHGFTGDGAGTPQMPSILIATAAGDVGVDLDAEHAVCDVVAWERIVQRLGRVNRKGMGDATVVIIPSEAGKEDEQLRHRGTCELIRSLPLLSDGSHDGSPRSLGTLNANPALREILVAATTPDPLHPPLTRALVEAWAMTSLDDHAGRPEVGPWLRGWPDDKELPKTTLIWRHFLPIDDEGRLFTGRAMELYLDAASPHLAERLEVDTWRVLDWLANRAKLLERPSQERNRSAEDDQWRPRGPIGVILEPRMGNPRPLRLPDLSTNKKGDLERALGGALLLLDSRFGGLRDGLLLDDADEPAIDVTEIQGTDRITPFRIRRVESDAEMKPAEDWRVEGAVVVRRVQDVEAAWLVIESLIQQGATSEDGRSGARRAQLLEEHQEWTEAAARKIAVRLAPEHYEVVAVAAALHDEGKRAETWQRAFNAPSLDARPYAKTLGRPNVGLLNGYRHELGSLPYAEAHERFHALPVEFRDLCLHLIVSHHGNGRPCIQTSGAQEPPSRLQARAREIALRFFDLQKIWGPWGLAWWECLLRAADQQASRRNDQERTTRG